MKEKWHKLLWSLEMDKRSKGYAGKVSIIAALLLFGCGQQSKEREPPQEPKDTLSDFFDPIDNLYASPELLPWLVDFSQDADKYATDLWTAQHFHVLSFKDLPSNLLGRCVLVFEPDEERVRENLIHSAVFINKTEKSSEANRLRLISYHELGHCLLLQCHSSDYPSIMFPILTEKILEIENWDVMVQKLFTEGIGTFETFLQPKNADAHLEITLENDRIVIDTFYTEGKAITIDN